jgi:hypothetical protein
MKRLQLADGAVIEVAVHPDGWLWIQIYHDYGCPDGMRSANALLTKEEVGQLKKAMEDK